MAIDRGQSSDMTDLATVTNGNTFPYARVAASKVVQVHVKPDGDDNEESTMSGEVPCYTVVSEDTADSLDTGAAVSSREGLR